MTTTPRKLRVLFVGAFREAASDGTRGGQIVACGDVLDSPLSEQVDWIKVDSTQRSFPAPSLASRTLAAARRLILFVRSLRRADAVLIFTPALTASLLEKGTMAVLASLAGRRVVVALRSEIPGPGDGWLRAKLMAMTVATTDALWLQSPAAARRLEALANGKGHQVRVVPNFINFQGRGAPAPERDASEHATFFYAGWLIREKGLFELLDAFATCLKSGIEARLILTGDGPARAELKETADRLGIGPAVTFTGWLPREEVLEIGSGDVVFVLPSYTEGSPNFVREALILARPVIASDVGGTATMVRAGETGFLVEPRSAAPLVEPMRRLAADPELRRRMGAAGRRLAEERLDGRKWSPVVFEMLAGRPPGEPAADGVR